MLLPAPFSSGLFVYGEPILVAPKAGKEELELSRLALENALNAVNERAERGV